MINIGKSYVSKNGALTRLCSDVLFGDDVKTLWVEVEESFAEYLCGSEVFLAAVLPLAMRQGVDIVCEDSISEELLYHLTDYFIPAFKSDRYREIKIKAQYSSIKYDGTAVGCNLNDLSELLKINVNSITHVLCDEQNLFDDGLNYVFLSSNFSEFFEFKEEYDLLKFLYPLALPKLFDKFIISIPKTENRKNCILKNSHAYYLLMSNCFSFNSVSFALVNNHCKERNKNKKVLKIHRPYIDSDSERTFLRADIDIADDRKNMYFSVENEYGEGFVTDRADAFLAATVTFAMREGFDIECEAPISESILFGLRNYLIPTLAHNVRFYNLINISAESIGENLENSGAVATGWTGGVDSFYTYLSHSAPCKSENSKYSLTHLFVNNNGAIESEEPKDTLSKMVEKTRNGFAKETGKKVVGVDTNIQEIFPEKFLTTVSFRHCAVVLALQKLLSVYLISSSYAFSEFDFKCEPENVGYYELAIYQTFSNKNIKVYSSGGGHIRVQKVKALMEVPLSHKYLHPCIHALRNKNCGKCGKCVRMLLLLDALGVIDKYSQVFDLDWYRENLDWCLSRIFLGMGPVGKFIVSTFKERGYNLNKPKFIAFRVFLWRKFLDVKNSIKVLR